MTLSWPTCSRSHPPHRWSSSHLSTNLAERSGWDQKWQQHIRTNCRTRWQSTAEVAATPTKSTMPTCAVDRAFCVCRQGHRLTNVMNTPYLSHFTYPRFVITREEEQCRCNASSKVPRLKHGRTVPFGMIHSIFVNVPPVREAIAWRALVSTPGLRATVSIGTSDRASASTVASSRFSMGTALPSVIRT